jgi:hypothetical protein
VYVNVVIFKPILLRLQRNNLNVFELIYTRMLQGVTSENGGGSGSRQMLVTVLVWDRGDGFL